MIRWKFTIEYKGTNYAGWQKQNNVPSIQEEIEKAIYKFSGQDVPLSVAGRTDAGVHARAQIAHVDLVDFKKPMSGFEVAKAINAHLLPQPIAILNAEIVPNSFHARYDATNKLYHYRIINRLAALGIDDGLAWHFKRPLDVSSMRKAAQHLVGNHDFTTFRDSACQANSPQRTLDHLDIFVQDYDACGGGEIVFAPQARSFLHHMVRNIVGTLVMVGEGKWQPDDVKVALEAKDRTKGGMTAPAEGLYLMRIDY